MNKRKLVQVIVKDLEELKILSEEVADSQNDSSLVIDLALNKARLLIHEIELLREFAGNSDSLLEDPEESNLDEEEDEVSDVNFSDPELEILNFEEPQFPETEESLEEEIDEDDLEEKDQDEELDNEEENENDEDELEDSDNALDDDDLTEDEDEDSEDDMDEEEQDEETEIEEPQQKTNIQVTELNGPQPGTREIHIDDSDDDDEDVEPINFSTSQGSSVRPPMREIPKPENTVVGETFQKERSLNDSIGENKSMESKLTNGPITSLRAAIGLNDRFIFIREIFNNNTEKYNAIIEQLDKMEDIQQAVGYLKANLTLEKNETSLKFVDLLKRRFTK